MELTTTNYMEREKQQQTKIQSHKEFKERQNDCHANSLPNVEAMNTPQLKSDEYIFIFDHLTVG